MGDKTPNSNFIKMRAIDRWGQYAYFDWDPKNRDCFAPNYNPKNWNPQKRSFHTKKDRKERGMGEETKMWVVSGKEEGRSPFLSGNQGIKTPWIHCKFLEFGRDFLVNRKNQIRLTKTLYPISREQKISIARVRLEAKIRKDMENSTRKNPILRTQFKFRDLSPQIYVSNRGGGVRKFVWWFSKFFHVD